MRSGLLVQFHKLRSDHVRFGRIHFPDAKQTALRFGVFMGEHRVKKQYLCCATVLVPLPSFTPETLGLPRFEGAE
jgi:hypothetical protein